MARLRFSQRRFSVNMASSTYLEDRGVMTRALIRWAVLGAAGVVALIIALSHGTAASAACIPINYGTCVDTTTYQPSTAYSNTTYVQPGASSYVQTNTTTGFPGGALVSTYVDPRYCGGIVNIVTDPQGKLINVCPDGTRVFPVFSDNPFYGGYGPGFLGTSYINGNYSAINGNYSAFYGGTRYVQAYNCNNFFNACNNGAFPTNGTFVGGAILTKDNRFCGDGNVLFAPGSGYFCQNGSPLFRNGNGIAFPGNGFGYVGGYYRPLEVSTTTTATTTDPAPATVDASAPIVAPVTAAPVAPAAAPVVAPATTQAPEVAPVVAQPAQIAGALNPTQAPVSGTDVGGSGVHTFSAPATTPTATVSVGRDDHSG